VINRVSLSKLFIAGGLGRRMLGPVPRRHAMERPCYTPRRVNLKGEPEGRGYGDAHEQRAHLAFRRL
jgi:hypothetical protein